MEKIQELTEKIYREGVEKGKAEAARIVEEANAEAAKIVAAAKEQAEAETIKDAPKRARRTRKEATEAEAPAEAPAAVAKEETTTEE